MIPIVRICILSALFLLVSGQECFSQGKPKQASEPAPSQKGYADRVRDAVDSALEQESIRLAERKMARLREAKVDEIRATVRESQEYLQKGIDSAGIKADLEDIRNWYAVLGRGIFSDRVTIQTHRNLATSSVILQELINRLNSRKAIVDKHRETLSGFSSVIDSLSLDSVIWALPEDSAAIKDFLNDLVASIVDIRPADSTREQAEKSVIALQRQINPVVAELQARQEDIQRAELYLSDHLFDREVGSLTAPAENQPSLQEVWTFSNEKTKLALVFYIRDNPGKFIFLLIALAIVYGFLLALRKAAASLEGSREKQQDMLVLQNPLASALVIAPSIYQFIFVKPPFVLYAIFLTVSSVALTWIFRHYISRYWLWSWLSMLILGILAGLDNLMLLYAQQERWILLILAASGLVASIAILLGGHRKELRVRAILYFIGFVAVFEALSILANIYGRYNLAKSLMTTGFFNVVTAILFLWVIRLINEGLALASKVYESRQKAFFLLDFSKVGSSVSPFFYLLMIMGWLFLLGKHFYAFNLVLAPIREFIVQERQMGDFSFSIGSLLLFFVILGISALASRFVSYFATDVQAGMAEESNQPKNRLGSWLLLVRIVIITLGLLLAFAATGIPMDRITIILGALGVGVGLGLQALVNNLVSGLILAFEKPVNVGDIVEVGNKSGTVLSIGFRSSTIRTFDGSNVIIPNGDLLSAHLVNWTGGNHRRRVEIAFGISYGADLDKVKNVLESVLASNEMILHKPRPSVLFRDMSKQLIGITIYFWISHSKDWLVARSEIIADIDRTFQEEGIIVPFNPASIFGIKTAGDIDDADADEDDEPPIGRK
jgi:small-conductance mechanosensitive channel